MILNDDRKTLVNVVNICWVSPSEAQMGSSGPGLMVRYAGGGSAEIIEYKDPEDMDVDIQRIEASIEKLENPKYYSK